MRQVERLVTRGLLLHSCFTPTDALHVLGEFQRWNVEAARLGAQILAARARISVQDLCTRVTAEVSNRVTRELVTKVLSDESALPDWSREPSAVGLLARAMGSWPGSDLDCRFVLRQPVVAVGAPVAAYLPRTAQQLGTELVIPRHAAVGNAVGAVAGGVVQRARVLIRPIEGEQGLRAYLPEGIKDFRTLDQCVAYACKAASKHLEALARQAGADQVEIHMDRIDRLAPVQVEWGEDVFVETELMFTAVGRPGLARAD
jgi:N-methylhydantoinase A/oxoprolinase/acetone carboxylase beta subunit